MLATKQKKEKERKKGKVVAQQQEYVHRSEVQPATNAGEILFPHSLQFDHNSLHLLHHCLLLPILHLGILTCAICGMASPAAGAAGAGKSHANLVSYSGGGPMNVLILPRRLLLSTSALLRSRSFRQAAQSHSQVPPNLYQLGPILRRYQMKMKRRNTAATEREMTITTDFFNCA